MWSPPALSFKSKATTCTYAFARWYCTSKALVGRMQRAASRRSTAVGRHSGVEQHWRRARHADKNNNKRYPPDMPNTEPARNTHTGSAEMLLYKLLGVLTLVACATAETCDGQNSAIPGTAGCATRS